MAEDCKKFHITDLLMSGKKSYMGLAVIVCGMAMKYYGPDFEVGMQMVDAGSAMFGVGAAHKVDKLIKAVKVGVTADGK